MSRQVEGVLSSGARAARERAGGWDRAQAEGVLGVERTYPSYQAEAVRIEERERRAGAGALAGGTEQNGREGLLGVERTSPSYQAKATQIEEHEQRAGRTEHNGRARAHCWAHASGEGLLGIEERSPSYRAEPTFIEEPSGVRARRAGGRDRAKRARARRTVGRTPAERGCWV
ncbi:hypothetical protein B0H10DRAFT_1940797 [Mycena sp. CBHHK59/15]|nr:hypothetical protein B0H10DRAFT_1940797 [Mycena sp. CBHHK59/15]